MAENTPINQKTQYKIGKLNHSERRDENTVTDSKEHQAVQHTRDCTSKEKKKETENQRNNSNTSENYSEI